MNSNASVTHEEITQRARDIWEQCGRPEGQDREHWLRAERELRQEREQASWLHSAEPAGDGFDSPHASLSRR